MSFNSIQFAFFLPIVFLLYWFVFNRNLKVQNLFVVVVSYVFYGWWDYRFLFLIAFTSLCSWGSGLLIEKYADNKRKARLTAGVNIVVNLLILGVFKYYDFFVSSFGELFGVATDSLLLRIILPVGISFYTFQALSYSIDVYRGQMKATRDVVQFFAYVSFFPQLVAGPIERATNLLPQFAKQRKFDYAQSVDGCRQMLWGLFKKIVIADNCALFVDKTWADLSTASGSTLLLVAVLFSFQIYGDFSGYSDVAIGCGKLFGIRLRQNFNVPYFSRNVQEFWRRWHMSLLTWFRDYIYFPLGGSRCSKVKVIRNTLVVFGVSGLWHGANWTYIVWGFYHALLFFPSLLFGGTNYKDTTIAEGRKLPSVRELVIMCCTFLLVTIGWIIFRADSLAQAVEYLSGVCSFSLFTMPDIQGKTILFANILLLIFVEWIHRKQQFGLSFTKPHGIALRWGAYLLLCVDIICFGGHAENFIYFQF